MKKIIKLARSANAFVVLVTYNNHGQIKIGYDIVDTDWNILISYEPYNGITQRRTSWTVRNRCTGNIQHIKNLNSIMAIKQDIQPGPTGYKFGINV